MSDSNFDLAAEFKRMQEPMLPDELWDAMMRLCPTELNSVNHFNITDYFEMALTDSKPLIDATLTSNPKFLEVTPLLRYGAKLRTIVPASNDYWGIRLHESQARALAIRSSIAQMALRDDMLYQMLSPEKKQEVLNRMLPTFAQLIDDNMSQAVRATQEEAWKSTQDIFLTLAKQAALGWNSRGLTFALRPPIAMNSTHVPAVLSASPLAGIPMPEMYYTKAQSEFLHLLRIIDSNMLGWFDPRWNLPIPVYPEPSKAESYRLQGLQWLTLGANAILRAEHTSDALVSTMRELPPWLMFNHATRFVLYKGQPMDHGLAWDIVQPISFQGMEIFTASAPERAFMPAIQFTPFDAIMVQLIPMAMTLLATQIKLGRGNRNPSWTHSPPNRAFIEQYFTLLKGAADHAK